LFEADIRALVRAVAEVQQAKGFDARPAHGAVDALAHFQTVPLFS